MRQDILAGLQKSGSLIDNTLIKYHKVKWILNAQLPNSI